MAAEPTPTLPPLVHPRLTSQELLILLTMEDDTEEAPWMVMSDAQFETASDLYGILRLYAAQHDLPWYVASMLSIRYRVMPSRRRRKVSPDLYVAFPKGPRPRRRRTSYDVEREGGFPPFVLEVVSSESLERDLEDKRLLYWEQGAREYVLFNPTDELDQPVLQGYRRDGEHQWEPWTPVHNGLDSEVLGLRLFVEDSPDGPTLRAATRQGMPLLTLAETAATLEQEIARRRTLEEEAARSRALEEEVAQLRAELQRLKGGH